MKNILHLFALTLSCSLWSQTGISTTTPHESAVLDLTVNGKALLLSRMQNTAAISNPKNGMIIYDKSSNCIKSYENNAWSGCIYTSLGKISGIDCSTITHNGTLISGIPAENVYSIINYTGGSGKKHYGQSVASTGVTGLTAVLDAGTLNSGNGTLLYKIIGTPASSGVADFAINIGGQSCTLTHSVTIPVPATITLAQNQSHIVSSIYDTDYLPYTVPGAAAVITAQAADGTDDAVIDVQGTITPAGITVNIPATATAAGTLPAYTSTPITVPANLTQDGIARKVVISWPSHTYTSGSNKITATIKTLEGPLNIKKLDINSGVGQDYLGVVLGTITYHYNGDNTTAFTLRAVSGIPDRMFNIADNTGSTTSHQFVYVPVVGEDGKIWLNNNLGANYSNLNKPVFNPGNQATVFDDFNAFGNFFQWGRFSDGHELVNWANNTSGTLSANTTTLSATNSPADVLFIIDPASPNDWLVTRNNTLWQAATGTNNPCPAGFRVPAQSEMTAYVAASGISNNLTAHTTKLRFPIAGARNFGTGLIVNPSNTGYYWTTNISGTYARSRYFAATSYEWSSNRAGGMSVRCIKQ